MRRLQNIKVVIGIFLMLGGLGLMLAWGIRVPAREIGRIELRQLLDSKLLSQTIASPTPFPGIYHIEARHQLGKKSEKVFITTHLDDAEVHQLFVERGIKVDLPGEGLRAQWVSVLSTVMVLGLVIGLMFFQFNLGRG